MITPFNLYKLLVADFFPKCVNCQHYRPGVISHGYCKVWGSILHARTSSAHLCGLEGLSFKSVNPPYKGHVQKELVQVLTK